MEKKENGITLVSLVVTMVLMLILAGAMISIQSTDNDATNLALEKNEEAEILSITEEIKTYLTENPPETWEDLIISLKNFGMIVNETDTENAKLITNDGGYVIYVKSLWNVDIESIE